MRIDVGITLSVHFQLDCDAKGKRVAGVASDPLMPHSTCRRSSLLHWIGRSSLPELILEMHFLTELAPIHPSIHPLSLP